MDSEYGERGNDFVELIVIYITLYQSVSKFATIGLRKTAKETLKWPL